MGGGHPERVKEVSFLPILWLSSENLEVVEVGNILDH